MIERTLDHIKKNSTELIILAMSLVVAFILGSFLIVQKEVSSVYSLTDDFDDRRVGIVFGAGFSKDGPLDPLEDRLETAVSLYTSGKIEKLLLTGDGQNEDYNEPKIMEDYLYERGIPRNAMRQDPNGRSTYESCERAVKKFSVGSAILISQQTHLPRAIYLCEHFGIDAIGVKAEGPGSSPRRFIVQSMREVFARTKAVFNANIIGEDTLIDEQMPL